MWFGFESANAVLYVTGFLLVSSRTRGDIAIHWHCFAYLDDSSAIHYRRGVL